MAAIDDELWMADRVDFWNNVYGFKMTCLRDLKIRGGDAIVDVVSKDAVVSTDQVVQVHS